MKSVLFIVGPTCSGKTDLTFYLAPLLDAKVINADSLQMYKYMDIGTAKPNLKKFSNIDCYLFDHIFPPQIYTAGQYEKDASLILKKFLPFHTCLVVGGSGFYLQALEKGCYPIQKVKESFRQELLDEEKSMGLSHLYEELKMKDPKYASQVHPNDKYRIVRALSLIRSEKVKMSDAQTKFKIRPFPYHLYKIGLTGCFSVLKKKVEMRVHNMIHKGLIEEVQRLLNKKLENFIPMQSVGYKETLMYLKGEISIQDLPEKIIQRTMKLIKKQKSWFKADKSIRWYDCETDFQEIFNDLKLNGESKTLI